MELMSEGDSMQVSRLERSTGVHFWHINDYGDTGNVQFFILKSSPFALVGSTWRLEAQGSRIAESRNYHGYYDSYAKDVMKVRLFNAGRNHVDMMNVEFAVIDDKGNAIWTCFLDLTSINAGSCRESENMDRMTLMKSKCRNLTIRCTITALHFESAQPIIKPASKLKHDMQRLFNEGTDRSVVHSAIRHIQSIACAVMSSCWRREPKFPLTEPFCVPDRPSSMRCSHTK